RAGRGPVAGDDVVDQENVVAAGDVHAVPGVAVDRVADQIVRATGDVDRRDPVAAVAVDQAVGDEGVGVTAGDGDAAVTRGGPVAEDPETFEVDRLVVIGAAQEQDGPAGGARDGEAAEGNELRLLEPEGLAVNAPSGFTITGATSRAVLL